MSKRRREYAAGGAGGWNQVGLNSWAKILLLLIFGAQQK
jgi:hypothetical protein